MSVQKTMGCTKTGLVQEVYKKTNLQKKDSEKAVELFFEIMKQALSRGEKVMLSGFGTFSVKDQAQRVGRNPQTGEPLEIASRRNLAFKVSRALKDDINSRYAHRMDSTGKEDQSIPPKKGTSRALSRFVTSKKD